MEKESCLTFMGVEVESSLSDFVAEMENVGFSLIEKAEEVAHMKGDVYEEEGILYIETLDEVIDKITIYIDIDKDENDDTFLSLCKELNEEYGNFDYSGEIETLYGKLMRYKTWNVDNAEISLEENKENLNQISIVLEKKKSYE